MRFSPGQGLSLCFKKAIDHDGPAFFAGASRFARRFAILHRSSGIDRSETAAVGKHHFAAVRNVARIDGAVADAQALTRGGFVAARVSIRTFAAAGPVNGDPGKKRFVTRGRGRN